MSKIKGMYLLLAFLLFLPILTGHASVPLLVNYQGTVKDATGAAINADGYFKFAIVDQAGTVASWVNNGNLLNGSEPPNAVITPVTNGRFLIKLGDNTNLSNMAALTESVFDNSPLYLRVWFSLSETGPYELFMPDTEIVSTGYAIKAAAADRALVADEVTNIDTLKIQSRVSGSCTGGDTISAINQDGTVACEVDNGTVYTAGNGVSITAGTISVAVGGVGNAQISDVAWSKLSGIPADIADGDNVGIIIEVDPTVPASLKDGISWNELTGIPAGFADGADNGILSEVDGVIGNEVTNATDSTLMRNGSGTSNSPYTLGLNLSNANVWSTTQTFNSANVTGSLDVNGDVTLGTDGLFPAAGLVRFRFAYVRAVWNGTSLTCIPLGLTGGTCTRSGIGSFKIAWSANTFNLVSAILTPHSGTNINATVVALSNTRNLLTYRTFNASGPIDSTVLILLIGRY
ncbi:MAG: hypothetical protein ACC707_02145 [Thiohalomonadales bacterium]